MYWEIGTVTQWSISPDGEELEQRKPCAQEGSCLEEFSPFQWMHMGKVS